MHKKLYRRPSLSLWVLFTSALALSACATTAPPAPAGKASPPKVDKTAPVTIEFKGVGGTASETRYYANSRSFTYEESQLIRDRQEGVDFTVVTRIDSYDPKAKVLAFKAKTVRKDGAVPLHSLAFPELKEEIDYIQRGNGEILKAGDFPKEGLFYVPSLPMPKEPVKIGDTWSMSHVWYSAAEGIPLRLEVIGILKDIVPCENSRCADIELSGGVGLLAQPTVKSAKFDSRIWGRLLFSLERGDIIWSEVRSQEEIGVLSSRTVVSSCMVSETKLGGDYKTKMDCDTGKSAIDQIPIL